MLAKLVRKCLDFCIKVQMLVVMRVPFKQVWDTDLDEYLCCDAIYCTCEGMTVREYMSRNIIDETTDPMSYYCDVCGHDWEVDDPCPYH